MTATYERSYCNQALLDAGLPVEAPKTISMLSNRISEMEQLVRANQAPLMTTVDGAAVRAARKSHLLPARVLAGLVGIHVSTLYALECGYIGQTHRSTAIAIAKTLHIPVETIINDSDGEPLAAD